MYASNQINNYLKKISILKKLGEHYLTFKAGNFVRNSSFKLKSQNLATEIHNSEYKFLKFEWKHEKKQWKTMKKQDKTAVDMIGH